MDFVALIVEWMDHLTDEYAFLFALWSIYFCDYETTRIEALWWSSEPRRVAALLSASTLTGLMEWDSDTNDLRKAVHTDIDRATCEAKYTLDTMRRRRIWRHVP